MITEKRRKQLKKSLIIISIIAAVVLAFSIFVHLFLEEKIKNTIVNKLNEQLNTEISVEKIDLKLFRDFPYASVRFYQVEAKEVIPDSIKDNLFEAENVYLQFSILDIFSGNYQIKRIECQNAYIKAIVFEDGTDNYHFWKEQSDSTSTEERKSFDLQKIIFKNTSIFYYNYQKEEEVSARIDELYVKAQFGKTLYDVEADGNVFINKIQVQQNSFLPNQTLRFSFNISVDSEKGNYEIKQAEIALQKMQFLLDGSFLWNANNKTVDLNIEGDNIDISKAIESLPSTYKNLLSTYSAQGMLLFKTSIKGNFDNPEIRASFAIENGSFEEKTKKITLNKIKIEAEYINAAATKNKDILSVKHLSAFLEDNPIKASFTINGFKKAEIECEVEAKMDLSLLKDFLANEQIEELSGIMDIQFKYSGSCDIKNLKARDFLCSNTSGYLSLQDLDFKHKDYKYLISEIDAKCTFNNEDLLIEQMSGIIGTTDFSLKGRFKQIFNYLFSNEQALKIDASFSSRHLHLEDFLLVETTAFKSQSKKEYEIFLGDKIEMDLELNIDALTFRRFYAKDITGDLFYGNNSLIINALRFNAMEGSVRALVKIKEDNNDKIRTHVISNIEGVNINQLFFQFENFGLESITDKNLEGKTKARVEFSALWSNSFVVDEESIIVDADVYIKEGKLKNYRPLEGLQDYIKEDLSEVSFSELKNSIFIKNKMLTIPEMYISSSAMNIEVSGTHSFSNDIEYHLKVLLSELKLTNKTKKERKENNFGPIKDDGLGRTSLFIFVYGTVDNPQYKLVDKEKLKEEVKENIRKEKKELKEVLNEEFGWFKKDTTLHKDKESKQTQTEFIIEWEDE